jgi:hypothetical protein
VAIVSGLNGNKINGVTPGIYTDEKTVTERYCEGNEK